MSSQQLLNWDDWDFIPPAKPANQRFFPRFSQLPIEIQVMIIKLAANPEMMPELDHCFAYQVAYFHNDGTDCSLARNFFQTSVKYFASYRKRDHLKDETQEDFAQNKMMRSIALARRNLQMTNRLARQITFESWLKDLQANLVRGSEDPLVSNGNEQLFALIRGLIEDLKRGDLARLRLGA